MASLTALDVWRQRNRRVASLLIGWIVAMASISMLVVVLR